MWSFSVFINIIRSLVRYFNASSGIMSSSEIFTRLRSGHLNDDALRIADARPCDVVAIKRFRMKNDRCSGRYFKRCEVETRRAARLPFCVDSRAIDARFPALEARLVAFACRFDVLQLDLRYVVIVFGGDLYRERFRVIRCGKE